MKYAIHMVSRSLSDFWRYEISLKIGGSWFRSETNYKNYKDAVRAAKRAGGTEEIK